ncbi:HAD-IIB family hydrolase [Rhodoferax antarcticus]|uniref:HAD-IIB family hydrolase n=1 Tax=Rhodoferax antarcticus TaxID=81479 RepID=UPI00222554E4|nr:HAD-IIB family hydrolase [Rhodoferax antarcticus]MCW2312532.1 sucrose-6F-phosphate phosphohydrolase [Rhodoferax antarcticus]
MRPFLLCTDLDRTLIPNGAATESPYARAHFANLVRQPHVTLAYVSGRNLAQIEEAIKTYQLPTPNFAITDVGSSIYQRKFSGWQSWRAWDVRIGLDWDWAGASAEHISSLLADVGELRLQEPEKQARHKLSFYAPLSASATNLKQVIEQRLAQHGVQANVIWSVDEETQLGLVDILPARAGKRQAVEFLMQARGFSREQTVFAGDSGNDLDVMLSDIPAVLVANAHPEVKARSVIQPHINLYIAKGDFLGMNGNYSAGILEGISHFRPDIRDWLRQQHVVG